MNDEELESFYQKHNLCKPAEYDYLNSKTEWCRFCGARKSRWGSGPWGRKTLCEIHSKEWKNKKIPEIENIDTPDAPICPNKNTEVLFLSKLTN